MLEAEILPFGDTGSVRAAPHRSLVSLAAFAGSRAPLEAALGGALPPPGRTVERDGTKFLWSGAATWLALSADPALPDRLAAAAENLAAVTDQSDGRIVFLVDRPDALQKLVPIDLHESEFGPDATALTLAGHIPVQIWREADTFALACFRSYGASLYHALVEAVAS